jgi:hypothetical protein
MTLITQAMFGTLCLVVVPWGLWTMALMVEHVRVLQAKAPHYPQFGDFIYALTACVVLCLLRWVLSNGPFCRVADALLPIDKDLREERVKRCAQYLFKLSYDIVFCAYGYKLMRHRSWMPPEMGGSGNIAEAFSDSDLNFMPWDLKIYYQISLGYHLHSLAYHSFWTKRRNDFIEMLLHHLVTVFLIGFSYMFNFLKIGLIVMLVHDVSDIPGYLVRIFVDTANFNERSDRRSVPALAIFLLMMSVLAVLHFYWYALFIRMGMMAASSGKTEDIVGKVGSKPLVIPEKEKEKMM